MEDFGNYGKLSRLFTSAPLKTGAEISLSEEQTHYLRNVLRKEPGENVRIFDGHHGEWLCEITALTKKTGAAKPQRQIREQPAAPPKTHLVFAPVKKARMDFLIEKSVELGATDLHPVITSRTENRHLNEDRLRAQVLEAAEQCERMDIPAIHTPLELPKMLSTWSPEQKILWAYERSGAVFLTSHLSPPASVLAFLLGPEGGFDDKEAALLSRQPFITPVTLGDSILRAETAALFCLSLAKFHR